MLATKRHIHARGFTLIEILVAIALLVIVLGIVYGAYSSVVLSVERTREASERLKTTQFIVRGFSMNLAQATEGWSPGPAYRRYSGSSGGGDGAGGNPSGVAGVPASGNASADGEGDMRFPFMGEIKRTADGTFDSLSFGSTAPMLGGGQLPGQIKMCTYRLEKEKSEEDDEEAVVDPKKRKRSKEEREEAEARRLLVLTETPWTPTPETQPNGGLVTPEEVNKRIGDAAEDLGQKPVTRSTVVYGLDLAYFDGKDWVEEWHSDDVGYLPWCVRVRVKLDRNPGEEPSTELNPEKDPSVIELLFSVPTGAGIHDGPPDYVRPSQREETR